MSVMLSQHLIGKWSIHKYSLNFHSVPRPTPGSVRDKEVKELDPSLIEFTISPDIFIIKEFVSAMLFPSSLPVYSISPMYFSHEFPFSSLPRNPWFIACLAVGTALTALQDSAGKERKFCRRRGSGSNPISAICWICGVKGNQSNSMSLSFLILKAEIIIPTYCLLQGLEIIYAMYLKRYVCGRFNIN